LSFSVSRNRANADKKQVLRCAQDDNSVKRFSTM
jgi:hypothetical protein